MNSLYSLWNEERYGLLAQPRHGVRLRRVTALARSIRCAPFVLEAFAVHEGGIAVVRFHDAPSDIFW